MAEGSATAAGLRWWPLMAVALACLLPLPGLWDAPGPPMEEGFMLVFPELVRQGFVPNEDFLHLYGPGSLWVLAAVYELFGTTLAVERAVGFLQQVGLAFAVLALLRPWGRIIAATGGVIAAVIVVPPIGLTALAWVGGVALGLWSLHLTMTARTGGGGSAHTPVTTAKSSVLVLGGVLGGVALLYRPDLVLAVGGSLLVAGWGLAPAQRWQVAGGLALGLSPYLVHLAMAGVGNVVDGLFIEPVFDLRGGRRLPLPPSWSSFDGFLQRAGELIEPPWPLPAPGSPAQLTLWLLLLVVSVVALLVAGISAARRGDRRLLAMAVFAAAMLPQALQRADSTHLAWVTCVPLAFLPAAVAELLGPRVRWPARRLSIVAAATPVVLTLALVPHFTWRTWGDYVARGAGLRHVDAGVIERGDRRFPYGRLDAVAAVNELIPDVERVSSPGDSLFVGTGDLRKTPYSEAFLYYLFPELPPATRYIEMDPGVANAPDSGLAEELARADVVILSSIRDDWDEPNDSRVFGPNTPNDILEQDFCLRGSYGVGLFGRGLYELYTRCE